MTEESRRGTRRSRTTPQVRPALRADAILLYTIGSSILKSDRHDLEVLLETFHANVQLQEQCRTVYANARRYLALEVEGVDQRYKSATFIPAGELLAVYSGSLERVRSGEEEALNHSMDQGQIDFKYKLFVDGTPRLGDTRPGRLQLVNHSCGCHTERELAATLQLPVKLPACLSLGVAGRDTSWQALLMHLQSKASAPGADPSLVQDVMTVSQAWAAIRRRFRRRGVRAPRQLLLGRSFELVPASMSRNPAWLQPLRRVLKLVDTKTLFPRLDRGEGAPEVAVHQALLFDVIHSLRQGEGPVEHLFADIRWQRVRSSASRRSWVSILNKYGFPCEMEVDMGCRIDPVIDLVEIGQYAGASRDQLLRLTLWLATSMTSRQDDVAMVPADQGPLTWAPVRLSVSNIEFDDSCLRAEVRMHGPFTATSKDSLTRIERDGGLIGTVTQGRFRLLEAEYQP